MLLIMFVPSAKTASANFPTTSSSASLNLYFRHCDRHPATETTTTGPNHALQPTRQACSRRELTRRRTQRGRQHSGRAPGMESE